MKVLTRKITKRLFIFFIFVVGLFGGISKVFPAEGAVGAAALTQGVNAFKKGDYISAIFMLRRALTSRENFNADTYYMLITAEMASEDYDSAYKDCLIFTKNFFDSPYLPYIIYHKGRCLYFQKQYEKAIITLSDFCHEYPDNAMVAGALFWIGECFFVTYNYTDALSLYERVVGEYPRDAKAVVSQYRIEVIEQSRREEKLLHLLKETGEEYLAAREESERQEKLLGNDKAQDAKAQIALLEEKNSTLERNIRKLQKENDVLKLMVEGDMAGAARLEKAQQEESGADGSVSGDSKNKNRATGGAQPAGSTLPRESARGTTTSTQSTKKRASSTKSSTKKIAQRTKTPS